MIRSTSELAVQHVAGAIGIRLRTIDFGRIVQLKSAALSEFHLSEHFHRRFAIHVCYFFCFFVCYIFGGKEKLPYICS
jgi:hypothetical protein